MVEYPRKKRSEVRAFPLGNLANEIVAAARLLMIDESAVPAFKLESNLVRRRWVLDERGAR